MSNSENIFSVRNLSWSPEGTPILRDVNFDLKREEVLAIIGPSGSGKSVLLKMLAGVLSPTSGTIDRGDISNDDISLMFQEGALFDSMSVLDNVAFPLVNGRVPCSILPYEERVPVCEKALAILERVGLQDHAHKVPGQLSGGMRRRVSLARALVSEPPVALLDDPTSGLDPVASSVIMELIAGLHESYKTAMILVSHDLRRLLPASHRILALFEGEILFDGGVDDIQDSAPEIVREFVVCRYDLPEASRSSEVSSI